MTPNFTLSLSFEGIRLLHRVAEGWHLVGEVALDVPDMTAALTELRDLAMDLDPSGLRTKLLIPNDQIKFTSIDTTRTEIEDIHAALDGATPYAITDLAIDFDRTGGRTHIAAVALETLVEAEAFAVEHKFAPICFVAVPEPFTFRSEVFFGMSEFAKTTLPPGEDVIRDDKPVEVTGEIAKASKAEPDPAKGDEKPEPEAPAPKGTDVPETDDAPDNAPEDAPEEEVIFASRSRGPKAVVTPLDPPEIEPLFTHPKEPLGVTPVIEDQTAASVAPPVIAPEPARADKAPAPKKRANKKVAPKKKAAKEQSSKDDMTVFGARKTAQVGGKPRFLGLFLLLALLLAMAAVAMWANTLGPSGIAGWFRGTPEEAPVEIVVAPEAAPEPAPIIVETPIEEEVATVVAPVEEVAAPIPAADSPAGTLPILREPTGRVLSPSEADRTYAATGVYQRAPRMPLAPRTTSLDGLQQAVSIPATAPLPALELPEMALMFPDQPLGTQLNPPAPGITFQRDVRGFILATPEGTVTPDGVIVFAGVPDREPPLRPGTEIPEIVVTSPNVLPGDEGLRLVAGRPPLVPPLRPEGLAPVEEDVVIVAPAVADPNAPVVEGLNVVSGRPARTPPLRPDAFADLAVTDAVDIPEVDVAETERAAIVINPTDVLAADGTALRTRKPTLRPAGFEAPEIATFLADPALEGLRPSLRPEGLAPVVVAEEIVEDTPPEATDVSSLIAGIAAATPDNPIVSPTANAVVASARPDTRPRNFATVVASATARIARQPAAAEVPSAPARATGPIPGSVAQAATIDNAIRLRDLNLIGVYGRSNDRRALVRLSNGRYVKVEVGSTLDGGQVTAIGDTALNYVKSGRTYALELPSG